MYQPYILTPHTYMFNYLTGQIERDPNQVGSYGWRAVTSVLHPFSVNDVKKYIPNAEKVFLYNKRENCFWGYVVVRNSETGFFDPATY